MKRVGVMVRIAEVNDMKRKSPLRYVWGKWPGNEPIDDILGALKRGE